jgi:hypothetical protein
MWIEQELYCLLAENGSDYTFPQLFCHYLVKRERWGGGTRPSQLDPFREFVGQNILSVFQPLAAVKFNHTEEDAAKVL